jgi:hypothetical protein
MKSRITKVVTAVLLMLAFTLLAFQAISAGDGARCTGACVQSEVAPTPQD